MFFADIQTSARPVQHESLSGVIVKTREVSHSRLKNASVVPLNKSSVCKRRGIRCSVWDKDGVRNENRFGNGGRQEDRPRHRQVSALGRVSRCNTLPYFGRRSPPHGRRVWIG